MQVLREMDARTRLRTEVALPGPPARTRLLTVRKNETFEVTPMGEGVGAQSWRAGRSPVRGAGGRNEKFIGLAQTLGQLQTFNRDFSVKLLGQLVNLGPTLWIPR